MIQQCIPKLIFLQNIQDLYKFMTHLNEGVETMTDFFPS